MTITSVPMCPSGT